jgi:type IV secretion system protein VirD4
MAKSLMTDPDRDAAGRKKNHKLLFLIDEFPSLGRLGFFSDNLRVMAGYGIKAMLIVQSFKDIISAYGPANTIVDNCHITVAFAAADDDSCQKISHMAGKAVEYRAAESKQRRLGGFMAGNDTRSFSEQQRNILEPGDVRSLPYDEQLIFVTGAKPFRTKKVRYWEDAPFDGRATNIKKGLKGPDQGARFDLPAEDISRNPWAGVRAVGVVSGSSSPALPGELSQIIERDRKPLESEDYARNAASELGIDLAAFNADLDP